MDIRTIFRKKLLSLGELAHDQDLQGIWVPDDLTSEEVDNCIHSLFREKAQEYVRAYQATQHFECLLRKAFEEAGFRRFDEPLRILDICSGAGNSVIPLLSIFPKAEVIASDLSVELLAILKQLLASQGTAERATLVQMNAERLDFEDGTIDLVVGAAALHHLFRPDLTIASCGRILREGGLAVFFEPFEIGFVYMKLLYQQILGDPRAKTIDAPVRQFLKDLLTDINRRLGEDKSDPLYKQVDDKWLFSTHYFRKYGLQHGFKTCTTYSLLSGSRDFEEKMEVLLRAGIDRKPDALPDWAWELVRTHDRCLSPSGHLDCIYEGAILLQK
jgi:ubiquinone/menaquinone biosynthesis C-methylase UbiE